MRYTQHLGHFGALVISLVACGTSVDGGRAEPGPGGAPTDRWVCPACTPRAGGETSDFGDGSEYYPVGDGSIDAPTPCQLSLEASPIDAAAARALGFGAALDAVETSFDLPFAWTPRDADALNGGGPATGYTPETRLLGTTHVDALQHLTSTLEGCEDVLVARVATRLATADGALSIAGALRVGLPVSGAPQAFGLLDLSTARGTLTVDPPSSAQVTMGYVKTSLYFFPKGVRAELSVAELDPSEIGGDEVSYVYEPIGGQAPIDACASYMEPTDFEEPAVTFGDASLSDRWPEFMAKFRIGEAIPARWRDGTETTVQLDLGQPRDVCARAYDLSYQVPFHVSSADGRIDVAGEAKAYGSNPATGWLEIYDPLGLPADTFAGSTGIHGVDFGGLGAARWHTEVYSEEQTDLVASGEAPYHGEVTVEGIDDDGHVTGIPGAVTGVIEKLTW